MLTWQNIWYFRPPNLMEVMMLFLGMGSNFWVTYITYFIKNDTIKVCGPKKHNGAVHFWIGGDHGEEQATRGPLKAKRPC